MPRPVVQEWCSWAGGTQAESVVIHRVRQWSPSWRNRNGASPDGEVERRRVMTWLTYALAPIAEHSVIRMKPLMLGALLRASLRRIKVVMASACHGRANWQSPLRDAIAWYEPDRA